jgi:hypothetical protein
MAQTNPPTLPTATKDHHLNRSERHPPSTSPTFENKEYIIYVNLTVNEASISCNESASKSMKTNNDNFWHSIIMLNHVLQIHFLRGKRLNLGVLYKFYTINFSYAALYYWYCLFVTKHCSENSKVSEILYSFVESHYQHTTSNTSKLCNFTFLTYVSFITTVTANSRTNEFLPHML